VQASYSDSCYVCIYVNNVFFGSLLYFQCNQSLVLSESHAPEAASFTGISIHIFQTRDAKLASV
jgi:hypothetical protein